MWASDYFQVIHGDIETIGELTCTGNLPFGTWMDDFGDNINAVLASGDILGFITQAVSVIGPTFEQMSVGFKNLVALSGTKVSLARISVGGEFEVEDQIGGVYNSVLSDPSTIKYPPTGYQGLIVTSGAGSMVGCAKGQEVSVKNGRLYCAASTDIVFAVVVNPDVTPIASDGANGNNIRLRLKRVVGYKKP